MEPASTILQHTELPTRAGGGRRSQFAAEIAIALLLFLANQAFVLYFATMARWTAGSYSGGVAEFCRVDCTWYEGIMSSGYDPPPPSRGALHNRANWGFFPLFPLTARALHSISGGSSTAVMVLTGRLEFLAAIWAFLLLVRDESENTGQKVLAGALVAFNPYLIYGETGYSEPLYFALGCLAFYALARRRWVLAGGLGALLSASRVVGVLFVVPYALMALREAGWRGMAGSRTLKIPLGLVMCPLGLAAYGVFSYQNSGDALAFAHMQVAWGVVAANPLMRIYEAVAGYDWLRMWGLMYVLGLAAGVWLLRRNAGYGIFLLLTVAMASAGTIPSAPRYVWWQFPLLYAGWLVLRRRPISTVLYMSFAGGTAAFMILSWLNKLDFVR